jgi:KaiC/GvpD/RAD55 family RecA-like ATPase
MSQLYRCLSQGFNKRILIKEEEFISKYLQQLEKFPHKDFYESIFLYNQDHFDEFKKTHSLSGFDGVVTNKLIFDFDSKDLDQAKLDTIGMCNDLIGLGIEEKALKIFFSGSKGFHIEISFEPGNYITQPEFEAIVMHYGSNYETFDPRIKDSQRIFRLALSKHNSSGNYKIPLTVKDLNEQSTSDIVDNSIPEVVEAHITQIKDFLANEFINTNFDILSLVPKKVATQNNPGELAAYLGEPDHGFYDLVPDMSRKPKHMSAAKFALMEGFFDEGERNHACMILCATYRNYGYDKEIAYNMLKATLRKRSERLGLGEYDKNELWNTIIELVYSDTWKGGTYSEKEDALINKTIHRYKLKTEIEEKETLSISEISEKFKSFADNIDRNIVKTGIQQLDEKVLITSGMLVGLLGAPSSGKTSHSISFLEHQSNNNIGALMVSADMSESLLYARLMQRYCGISFKQILEEIKLKPYQMWPQKIRNAWDQVIANFSNVGFSFQSGPSIEDIARRIDEQEQVTGKQVKTLVVDYLEKMRCHINDPTHASGFNASRLADLTRDKSMATILLLQPQKSAGDPSDELLSMRKVKGASVIEQDCRVILTTWRPGFNPNCKGKNEDDVFSSIAIVKNNMGETNRIDFKFNGATGLLAPLNGDDENFLKEVMNRAQIRKAQAHNVSDGLYQTPQKSNRNYTAEKPHTPRHRALPTGYEKETKDLY